MYRIIFWNKIPVGIASVEEIYEYFKGNYDNIRKLMLLEPRGHKDQFGAVIFPPVNENSDYTLLFLTTSGYLDMCGHATIGVSTVLASLGHVEIMEPYTKIVYDTMAGKIEAKVNIKDGNIINVSIIDVESYFLENENIYLKPLNKNIAVDISYGGNYYAIAKSEDIGVELKVENIDKLIYYGNLIRESVYANLVKMDKGIKYPLAMITGNSREKNIYKSIVLFSKNSFDRSPCGTGTAARAALLYHENIIGNNESFIHESIIETKYNCKVIDIRDDGDRIKIVPEITGRAWITQFSKLIIDPEDPFRSGFII